jgi:hypothetical protein
MLSQKDINEIENEVNARKADIEERAIENYKANHVIKRFSPEENSEDKPKSKPGGNNMPEHGFKSAGDYFKSVISAAVPGGYESDQLRNWAKKTAGYMEEGDLSQGGLN